MFTFWSVNDGTWIWDGKTCMISPVCGSFLGNYCVRTLIWIFLLWVQIFIKHNHKAAINKTALLRLPRLEPTNTSLQAVMIFHYEKKSGLWKRRLSEILLCSITSVVDLLQVDGAGGRDGISPGSQHRDVSRPVVLTPSVHSAVVTRICHRLPVWNSIRSDWGKTGQLCRSSGVLWW